ncbi:hypothetical protein [Metabacillus malikii]|uniref:Uncharacterized protein n=1 Tax=Metabacillus malikii TaxID=1504265 RepID=A0ABT9ZC27_9BACI|nr:hypothetical protein [Metabacillus malikii]MDQ0229787.1 hypothetical protein [Metabacillus malikii]
MPKRKILVAGCVFSAMFGGAWYMDGKVNREYVEPLGLEEPDVQLLNTKLESPVELVTEEMKAIEKFKPREYVRVVAR